MLRTRVSRACGMGAMMACVVVAGCAGGGVPDPPMTTVVSLGGVDDDGDSEGPDDDESSTGGVSGDPGTTSASTFDPDDTTAGEEPGTTTEPGCVGDCIEDCLNGFDDDGDGDDDCDDLDCAEHIACDSSCIPTFDDGHGVHVLCPEPTTWTAARDACQSSGMHLVSIDDAPHNQWLVLQTQPLAAVSWWMGFSDLAAEGQWTWIDGAPVTYENWYPGEPNNGISAPEHCAAFPEHTMTAWNDLDCNDLHPFICEP